MKPASLEIQHPRSSVGADNRAGVGAGADFARDLMQAALPMRSNESSLTQAEPAAHQSRERSPGADDDALPRDGAEDQAEVNSEHAERAATGSALTSRGGAGLVAGRARDLRERTEHEMFGMPDLTQLSAQELSGRAPAAVTQSSTPPANAAAPRTEHAGEGRDGGAPRENAAQNASARVVEPSQGERAKSGGQQPLSAESDVTAEAPSADGAGSKGQAQQGGSQGSGPHAAPVGAGNVPASGASAPRASAAAQTQAPAMKAVDAAGATARSPAQLLKRLEKMPVPTPSAEKSAKPEAPVPAAALRGLAAALRQGGGTVTMRLAPEALGSLKVQITTHESKIIARFEASTDQARRLLSEHVESLRSAMESRGLTVDRIVIERSQGWTPEGAGSWESRNDRPSGGAGMPEESQPWNGGGQDPGHPDHHQGQDGPHAELPGHGRPGEADSALRGVGATGRAADSAGLSSSVALTDEGGPEQIIRLRVDAVA